MKERLQTPLLIELHLRDEKPFSSNPFSSVLIREIGVSHCVFQDESLFEGFDPQPDPAPTNII